MKSRAFLTISLALVLTQAQAGPPNVVVQGSINLGGSPPGTISPGVTGTGGVNGTVADPLAPVPAFVYAAPAKADVVSTSALASSITGPGSGLEMVYEFAATNLSSPAITVQGGGTVLIHVTGDLKLTGGTLTIKDGTRVVFFVDGATLFDYTQVSQLGTGNSLQIQGRGSVTVKAETIQGVAFANQTLTIDQGTTTGSIKMDASLLGSPQEGVEYIRVLPIVDDAR